jgi:arylsulfatase A-like enzyme
MKRVFLLILPAVIALLISPFVTLSRAELRKCDFNNPKDGYVDGWDLAQFAAYYGAGDLMADVNGDGVVDSADLAHFAGFFGAGRPNILLIIADDVGIDVASNLYPGLIDSLAAIPTYGDAVRGRPASLPNLTDRLAAGGMVFSNAWAQPYCSPSRATVITGLFEDKTQVTLYDVPMSTNHITFPQLLQTAGYSTALFGKWHLAGSSPSWPGIRPRQAGFDLFKGNFDSQLPNYWSYDVHIQDDTTVGTNYSTVSAANVQPRSLPGIAATKYAPVVKGVDTIEWIQARHAQNPDKPWFVWLAFNTSHVTTQSVPMVVPNADTLDTASYNEMVSCGGTFGTNTVGSCTGPQLMRAMSNSMDTVIGKVLDEVDKLGPNTYVIFIGDNGTPMFGGYRNQIDNMYITKAGRGKGTPYESGCRVPMVIRGPNIAAGQQKSKFVHLADLSATILTLAGLEPPATNISSTGATVDSDSRSLTPILFGSATASSRDPNEGYLLTETDPGTKRVGARNATYKVICNGNTSNTNCTFYNLIDDPLEESPLSKPGSCADYNNTWTPTNWQWHYCRLIEVIATYSIF